MARRTSLRTWRASSAALRAAAASWQGRRARRPRRGRRSARAGCRRGSRERASRARVADLLDQVGPRQERRVDAGAVVRGRHERDVGAGRARRGRARPARHRWRDGRRPGWSRARRRVRLTASASTSSSRTTTGSAAPRQVREGPLEQARHAALALAEQLAGIGMRVDVHEQQAGRPRSRAAWFGEAAGERRLAGSGWPGRGRRDRASASPTSLEPRAVAEREDEVVEQPLLQLLGQDDPLPAVRPGVDRAARVIDDRPRRRAGP